MITVNCTAISENVIESELFGHVKGAFTGAWKDKKGLVEEADGGTLFLDEIGDLGLSMQTKLLRLLQEGEYKPVGSTRTRQADNAHGMAVFDHGNAVDSVEQHQLHRMGQPVFGHHRMVQAYAGCERHQNGVDFA
jgi:transcriptional regulator with AAA-type ATPase domain